MTLIESNSVISLTQESKQGSNSQSEKSIDEDYQANSSTLLLQASYAGLNYSKYVKVLGLRKVDEVLDKCIETDFDLDNPDLQFCYPALERLIAQSESPKTTASAPAVVEDEEDTTTPSMENKCKGA